MLPPIQPLRHTLFCRHRIIYEVVGPLAPAGVPILKPLENLRDTVLRYRVRPVPVVFLRLAFSPQLTASCQLRCPRSHYRMGCSRTLAGLSSGVSARGAGVLLDVKGAASCIKIRQRCALVGRLRYSSKSCMLGSLITYRNDGRACASCCGACQSWRYPSLCRSQYRRFGLSQVDRFRVLILWEGLKTG